MHIPICAFIFRLREFLLIRIVIQFPDLCRAAMAATRAYARSRYLKDLDTYKKLIKDTINEEINPVKFPQLWRGREHYIFMETYQEFFAAAATTNQLLEKSILKQVLKSQFAGEPALTDDFGEKLCKAHSKCKNEAKNMVNGDKTNKGVRRVSSIWKRSATTSSEATSFDVVESDNKDTDNKIEDLDKATTTQDNADDDAYQTSKKTLEVTVALFTDSSSSVGSSSTSKTLKRNVSSISVGSSGCSDVEASAACAEAKKQCRDGANKVVQTCFLVHEGYTSHQNYPTERSAAPPLYSP